MPLNNDDLCLTFIYLNAKFLINKSSIFERITRCRLFLHALTSFVDPAASIAKMFTALADHMVAPLTFLHPYSALGTLLEFAALDKLQKLIIILVASA